MEKSNMRAKKTKTNTNNAKGETNATAAAQEKEVGGKYSEKKMGSSSIRFSITKVLQTKNLYLRVYLSLFYDF